MNSKNKTTPKGVDAFKVLEEKSIFLIKKNNDNKNEQEDGVELKIKFMVKK